MRIVLGTIGDMADSEKIAAKRKEESCELCRRGIG
jgi:hypothetical protein